MAAESVIRSEVLFEGHVQGVGFRYTAQSAAHGYDVAGYVQNLPDGRVKLVAEGSKGEIDRFLADLGRRMEGHIHNQARTDVAATGEFTRFSIRQ
jgi:acylphosphatase